MLDLLIIGGGINGCGIARDAAGRGLSVMLVEQGDLAQATSSGSTKLIHGGLRYLEYYAFGLVRKALKEREALLAIAPHIIWPLTFILPHRPHLRPAWMIRGGLWLYDHMGGYTTLPRSGAVTLQGHPAGAILSDDIQRGYHYSDCWVQDARLVVLNAMDAAARGADIRAHTRCVHAVREGQGWNVTLRREDGTREMVTARMLVNASGPWVSELIDTAIPEVQSAPLNRVKGSHIVIPRLPGQEEAYILQGEDGRVVFMLPYEESFTLIGTTETPCEGNPLDAAISEGEVAYLCRAVNAYLKTPITAEDVVWSHAAVRPLIEIKTADTKAISRDYRLELDATNDIPLVSVYGGKLTTYRVLAEEVLTKLERWRVASSHWTKTTVLPGGDLPPGGQAAYIRLLLQRYPWLPSALARHYTRHYGTCSDTLLGNARSIEDLGFHYGAGLYAAEIEYLRAYEYARSADDILWRRTKWGLHLTETEREAVAAAV